MSSSECMTLAEVLVAMIFLRKTHARLTVNQNSNTIIATCCAKNVHFFSQVGIFFTHLFDYLAIFAIFTIACVPCSWHMLFWSTSRTLYCPVSGDDVKMSSQSKIRSGVELLIANKVKI